MRIDPFTQAWARWFSSMDVAFYRLWGNLSPLNWNKLVLTTRGRKTGRQLATPLLFLEADGKRSTWWPPSEAAPRRRRGIST